jgi:type II secretory pathway pseudopilin PulG
VLLGVLVVLLVAGAVVAHQVRESRQVREADAALERVGRDIKTQVKAFRRQQGAYPTQLRLRQSAVQLVGTSTTLTNGVYLEPGIRLAWYSDRPDPRLSTKSQRRAPGYSFCLSLQGRRWRFNATEHVDVSGGPPKGDCPPAPDR